MAVASSAAGLLTLLEDDSDDIKHYALVNLNKLVHEYWFQISASIASVEALYEDDEFKDRELAALIASKVFYYLGELDSALTYALGAGSLFDVNEQSEYVQTLIARCLDQYFEQRVRQVEQKEEVAVDERLVAVVERMIDRCCEQGQWEQAVGVAMEARRLDRLEGIISKASAAGGVGGGNKVLSYALRVTQQLVINRDFRQQVLRLLIRLYESSEQPSWAEICQCLMFLDDAPEVAAILNRLIKGSEADVLLAYQIGFDLVENEMQSFLLQVQERLPGAPAAAAAPAAAENGPAAVPAAAAADGPAAMDTDAPAAAAAAPAAAAAAAAATADANGAAADAAAADPVVQRAGKLRDILSGRTPIGLYLEFLYHHNHADLQVLKNIKGAIDARQSVNHSAAILANAFMHSGTSIDTFLRENLEWLSRATNWAKFSATAGLGVIHRGQLAQGRALMAPYLPRDGHSGSPYSEGGALYALGLITANHGADIRGFLLDSLRSASNPIIQHGGCLGLGLSALGTADEELFEDLKGVLYTDDAVAGEAAGISMGLLLAGSGASDKVSEMLAYAHDTQHEKIIRGLALGLALVSYGREEGADALFEQMARDQDPILRYGAMFVLGLAYRGTDNNAAVARLLHTAVSDVSDDVRRAAVMCLGFVLMNVPEQCPRIVALLAESFNPHVRYGAAMAVGIACAGSGLKEASSLLESMLSDSTDFVRQGAMIALALVMVQQPEARVAALRKRLARVVEDKHEEVMARMGAIMAHGILDAGGRNVTLGLRSQSGYFRRTSVVGLAVFTQYWYWYPLAYFLSLGFAPTALIGVDGAMCKPAMSVCVAAKKSTYAYPPPLTQEASKEVAKVAKAVLSTTAKARERQKKKDADKKGAAADKEGAGAMDTDEAPADKGTTGGTSATATDATASAAAAGEGAKEGAGADAAAADKKEQEGPAATAKEQEPSSYEVPLPTRVTPAMVPLVSLPPNSRWVPVAERPALTGIIVVRDTRPEEPVEYAAAPGGAANAAGGDAANGASAAAGGAARQEQEPAPPEPFEFNGA